MTASRSSGLTPSALSWPRRQELRVAAHVVEGEVDVGTAGEQHRQQQGRLRLEQMRVRGGDRLPGAEPERQQPVPQRPEVRGVRGDRPRRRRGGARRIEHAQGRRAAGVGDRALEVGVVLRGVGAERRRQLDPGEQRRVTLVQVEVVGGELGEPVGDEAPAAGRQERDLAAELQAREERGRALEAEGAHDGDRLAHGDAGPLPGGRAPARQERQLAVAHLGRGGPRPAQDQRRGVGLEVAHHEVVVEVVARERDAAGRHRRGRLVPGAQPTEEPRRRQLALPQPGLLGHGLRAGERQAALDGAEVEGRRGLASGHGFSCGRRCTMRPSSSTKWYSSLRGGASSSFQGSPGLVKST